VRNERIYRTEGIVVRRRDQGEADRVLTLCTPIGKLVLIAKGARKVRSRKAGHLELFAHVNVVIARSRSSWDIISQVDMLEHHAVLRGDLVRGTYARYAVELYDRFMAEGEGGSDVFDLLKRMFGYLCQENHLDLLARGYEQRLLSLVGFRPEWHRCVGEGEGHTCPQRLEAQVGESFGLDPEWGGVLCPAGFRASQGRRGVIPLSPSALGLLQACQREPFARLRELPTPPALLVEVEDAARHYITYYLERDVQSGAFLRRLKWETRES
jgi:DNA repair protein RecO (recombination protein O)